MGLGMTFLKIQKIIVKNAPTILAVTGAVSAGVAAGLAIRGTLKAQEELENRKREEKGDSYYRAREAQYLIKSGMDSFDICKTMKVKVVNTQEEADEYLLNLVEMPELDKKEVIWIHVKNYIPAALALGTSVACILVGNHISAKRILQLSGALALSKKSLEEYKDKVEEMIGKKKSQEIEDEVIQERILKNPPNVSNTFVPNMGNLPDLSLWYDDDSDRYFYSNIDNIRKAEIEAQRQLEKCGKLTRNDVYGILGIKEINLAETRCWIYEKESTGIHDEVILKTGAMLDEKGNPVGILQMNDHDYSERYPSNQWCGEI